MALAILEFISFDRAHARFRIDTGTNPYYNLKIGASVGDRSGIDWVDQVSHTTPMGRSPGEDNILNTSREIAIPANYLDKDYCYVQLFSFKSRDGRSPAFSKVIKVPVGFKNALRGDYLLSLSKNTTDMEATDFKNCRRIEHVYDASSAGGLNGAGAYAGQQSLMDDILSGIKIAAPLVLKLLSDMQNPAAGGQTGAQGGSNTGGQPGGQPAGDATAGMFNTILHALLHGLSGSASLSVSSPSGIAASQSLSVPVLYGASMDRQPAYGDRSQTDNRFSRPFIFGIDDALLATLAGPIIQKGLELLPQLMNSINQKKLQTQQNNNKLMTDLVSETNRRMLLQQLLQNQSAQGAAQNPNIAQLLQVLQQAAAAAPPPAAGASPVAAAQSLDGAPSAGASYAPSGDAPPNAPVLSSKAMLVFSTGTPLGWSGTQKCIYGKSQPVTFNITLKVPEPAPKNPLPKAIIKFYWRETGSQTSLLEKTFKQRDIPANTPLPFLFTREEIAALPTDKCLMVFAEMSWLTGSEREVKALGSTEIVLANSYFLKEQGREVSDERELADMKVYRSFWNKIWEAPVLDSSTRTSEGNKKYQWSLNTNLKYVFALTADHDSNGLMETRLLKGPEDKENLTEKTEGRMKGGLECSIRELNKLCTLWDKQALLPEEKLTALRNARFSGNNISECIYNVKLKGKAGERGMVWVIPVLKMVAITLNKIKTTNESGLVTAVEEEIVQFPLPTAARIIGLKSA